MNKTRRLVRLHLMMLLLILLPFAGFLWTVPNHVVFVAVLGAVVLVLAACIESIVQLTEREAMALQLKVREDAALLEQWKEKVRELDRIVSITTRENEELRGEAVSRQIRETAVA